MRRSVPKNAQNKQLSVDAGLLTLTNTNGVTIFGNGTGTVSILGDLNNINSALDQIFYNTANPGNNTLTATLTSLVNLDADPNNNLVDPSPETIDIEVLDFVSVDIVGQVFVDEDGDRFPSDGEIGIELVSLSLTGTDFLGNAVVVTAGPTNSLGTFSFSNLPASGDQPYSVVTDLDGVDPVPLVINRQGEFFPAPFNIPVTNSAIFNLPPGGGDFFGSFDTTNEPNEFVLRQGGTEIARKPIEEGRSVVINGSDQNDNLTIDYTNFDLFVDGFEPGEIKTFEIRYDGGAGDDSLHTTGGAFGVVVVNHADSDSGSIFQLLGEPMLEVVEDNDGDASSLDSPSRRVLNRLQNINLVIRRGFTTDADFGFDVTGTTIEFDNLEPLDMTGSTIDNLIINLPAGINHDTPLIPHGSGVELVSNNGAFERTAFTVPPDGSVLVNFGDGDDIYNGTAANAAGIVIAGGGGNDVLLGGIGRDVIFGEAGDDYI